MMPWVYEFRWEPGHIIFLMFFFSVAIVTAGAVVRGVLRTARGMSPGEKDRSLWKATFADLPQEARTCRHVLAGELESRICPNGFDCRVCDMHEQMSARTQAKNAADDDRFYHRGHTWVRRESEDTVVVGLDDLGRSLLGKESEMALPPPGTELHLNGTACTVRRNRDEARILSPVEGTVVQTGDGGAWLFKVRLSERGRDLTYLLTASEARFWLLKELERLQLLVSGRQTGAVLADGGVLVEDIPGSLGTRDCSALWEEMFLQA